MEKKIESQYNCIWHPLTIVPFEEPLLTLGRSGPTFYKRIDCADFPLLGLWGGVHTWFFALLPWPVPGCSLGWGWWGGLSAPPPRRASRSTRISGRVTDGLVGGQNAIGALLWDTQTPRHRWPTSSLFSLCLVKLAEPLLSEGTKLLRYRTVACYLFSSRVRTYNSVIAKEGQSGGWQLC